LNAEVHFSLISVAKLGVNPVLGVIFSIWERKNISRKNLRIATELPYPFWGKGSWVVFFSFGIGTVVDPREGPSRAYWADSPLVIETDLVTQG
jgi:hypothetical protein